MADFKVVKCGPLIPVCVTLHNSDTNQEIRVPTVYDPETEQVLVLNNRGAHDGEMYAQAIAATKAYIGERTEALSGSLVPEAVDEQTWDQIRVLTGLAKPPAQEL